MLASGGWCGEGARTDDNGEHGAAKGDQHPEELVVQLAHRQIVLGSLRRRRLYREPLPEDYTHRRDCRDVEGEREGGGGADVEDGLSVQRLARPLQVRRRKLKLHDRREREAGDERRRSQSVLESVDDVGDL